MNDKFTRLENLIAMKKEGLVDDYEFKQMKKEILEDKKIRISHNRQIERKKDERLDEREERLRIEEEEEERLRIEEEEEEEYLRIEEEEERLRIEEEEEEERLRIEEEEEEERQRIQAEDDDEDDLIAMGLI